MFFKNNKGFEIQKINTDLDEVLWVKVKILHWAWLVGLVYYHPSGSSYNEPGFFNKLEDEIWELKASCTYQGILLTGDFNARTSNETKIYNEEYKYDFGNEEVLEYLTEKRHNFE